MKRLAVVAVLLAATVAHAIGGEVIPCGTAAPCVIVGSPDGGAVQLGAVLQSSRFVQQDGGAVLRIQPVPASTPIALLGNQARTSTEPDIIIGGTIARDGGQGPIVSFRTGSYEIASITSGGISSNVPQTVTGLTVNGNESVTGTLGVGGVSTLSALDAGVRSKVGGVTIGGLLASDGGIATHVCEFGYRALSTGAIQVTFTRAFTSLPQCQCTHRNTTNSNSCTLVAATPPTITTADFAVASGGSDVVDYFCCGDL